MKEEIFICPLSQNGVKIVVAILHFSRLKTKGRGGSEHLPANVRHIENVLKVVSFQESLPFAIAAPLHISPPPSLLALLGTL